MPNPLVDRSWPVLRHLVGGHTSVYRASRGLIGHHVPGAPPMLLLDHIGARSGKVRTTPLAYLADGEDVVLVASKGGHPRNPAWFHNLMANPDTTIQVGSERRAVHARLVTANERERLWPEVVSSTRATGTTRSGPTARFRWSCSSRAAAVADPWLESGGRCRCQGMGARLPRRSRAGISRSHPKRRAPVRRSVSRARALRTTAFRPKRLLPQPGGFEGLGWRSNPLGLEMNPAWIV